MLGRWQGKAEPPGVVVDDLHRDPRCRTAPRAEEPPDRSTPESLKEVTLMPTTCGHMTCTHGCKGRGQTQADPEKGSALPRAL